MKNNRYGMTEFYESDFVVVILFLKFVHSVWVFCDSCPIKPVYLYLYTNY